MKKLITLIALLIVTLTSFATNYYVSNSGNNANAGTLAAPWATLAKVNSSMGIFVAGDSILFECGSEFFGTLNVTKAGVILGAYGTGNLPIITGFKTLSGWTNSGTNLWNSATASPKSYMKVVTLNGAMIRMGRYPDYADAPSAWFTYIDAIPEDAQPAIVNSVQNLPTTFIGGELVLRKEPYVLDVMPITNQVGNTFTCTNPDPFWYGEGNAGYFIQNHPLTVTSNNEWYFNSSTKNLTFYSSTGSPTGVIRGAVFDTLIRVTVADVTIENLDIQGSNRFGIYSTGSNFTLKNSIVRFAGYFGVQPLGSYTITNNTIRDIGSCAIYANNSGLIQGNQVKAIGMIDGMGASGNDLMFGIALESNNITVRNNVVDSISYSGIKIGGSTNGNNILIRENVVSNTCMNKTDGGAIYSYGAGGAWTLTNRVVKRNVLVNNGKLVYGMPGDAITRYYPMYMDGAAPNVIIDSNVIAYDNVSQNSTPVNGIWNNYAILLNNPKNITLTNNITFAYPTAISVNDFDGSPKPTGNTITNNCFYVNTMTTGSNYQQTNRCLFYIVLYSRTQAQMQADIGAMGTINNNYYNNNTLSPFAWTSSAANSTGFPVKLAGWQSFSGKDLNSTQIQAGTPTLVINYGTTGGDTTIFFSGLSKKDYKGTVYNNQATIPMYYANIFFDNGTAPSSPLSISSIDTTQINCFGNTTTLTVNATGGTSPYNYRLNTGSYQASNVFSGVSAGTYTVTVRDNILNTVSTVRDIYQPTQLTTNFPTSGSITTIGGTTTITQPAASGGSLNYVYNINNGTYQASNIFINRPAGTYTISVRDIRGCIVTKSITIVQPNAQLIISRPLIQN